MTYLAFLLLFVVLPSAVLLRLTRGLQPEGAGMRYSRALGLIALIAFTYTTPWDNYLVYSGVWAYGGDRVLGTLFYVPYEEYLFFLVQPVLTGLWMRWLFARNLDAGRPAATRIPPMLWLVPLALTAAGAALLVTGFEKGTYMGLILAWAFPVVAGLGVFSGRAMVSRARTVFWSIAVPTVYLWVADRLAIGNGIWSIDDATSLGFDPLGLPIEEAVFFLVTNILVVFGLVTFLFGTGRAPQAEITDNP
jgi:lycopene beta-cyclase